MRLKHAILSVVFLASTQSFAGTYNICISSMDFSESIAKMNAALRQASVKVEVYDYLTNQIKKIQVQNPKAISSLTVIGFTICQTISGDE